MKLRQHGHGPSMVPSRTGAASHTPALAAMFLASACAIAAISVRADAPHYCEIAMDFSIDGRAVAAPRAIVELGQAADITLGDEMHGWRFSIVADAPKLIRRIDTIPVEIDLYELAEGRQILRASPHLGVAPGQRADLETIFADDGRKAHIGLVANLRSDADVQAMSHGGDGNG